ncbi:DNA-(apurinic or apyrimidinic site) lyase isoform X2 [Cajanus cajan]|uniref:DNA-(apurinic or apyrimidinic site) endonuclease n=1 Tax=Cajanus cajan TaxID=3821 RepID=A0A151RVN6_CAJCA|nr:DNA-(apurinic or apyrimidinic site) lyase isoform X2 [Cajanus cajan]KYP46609.1 Exodeoxyribonuclease [Cajanus cajan]
MKRFFKVVEKDSDGSAKKPRENDAVAEGGENKKKEPLKFMTWNANSFLLRVKNNWPDFTNLITTFDPDVIAIQEVRMPAAGAKGASKIQGEIKDDTSASREEKKILMRALSAPPFGNYNVWWSLADSKYAGTALLVKKCFKPKSVVFNLDKIASKHEPDGRVILAEFETLRLLNTYVPNNGWKEEANSFQRRRKWDKRILEFVTQNSDKPLIWCGDLNVSHEEIDVSHPEFFSTAKLNGYIPPNKEDCGQPGFTLSERKRFGTILREGKLIDAYRFLNKDKDKDMERGFSWSGNPVGRYRGKRMRIDYFLVSEKLKERIVSCEMLGHGIELEGFYGSDHCPVTLELSPSSIPQNEDPV